MHLVVFAGYSVPFNTETVNAFAEQTSALEDGRRKCSWDSEIWSCVVVVVVVF